MAKHNAGLNQLCSQSDILGADVYNSAKNVVSVICAEDDLTIICRDVALHCRLPARLCIRFRHHWWSISSSNVREGLCLGLQGVLHCDDHPPCHTCLHDQDDSCDCFITRYGRDQSAGLVRVAAPLLRAPALSSGSE